MPLYILLLIAVVPVLAMVATAGNALGRDAQLAAVIALTIILSALVAWLVVGTVRIVRQRPNRCDGHSSPPCADFDADLCLAGPGAGSVDDGGVPKHGVEVATTKLSALFR